MMTITLPPPRHPYRCVRERHMHMILCDGCGFPSALPICCYLTGKTARWRFCSLSCWCYWQETARRNPYAELYEEYLHELIGEEATHGE